MLSRKSGTVGQEGVEVRWKVVQDSRELTFVPGLELFVSKCRTLYRNSLKAEEPESSKFQAFEITLRGDCVASSAKKRLDTGALLRVFTTSWLSFSLVSCTCTVHRVVCCCNYPLPFHHHGATSSPHPHPPQILVVIHPLQACHCPTRTAPSFASSPTPKMGKQRKTTSRAGRLAFELRESGFPSLREVSSQSSRESITMASCRCH